jgi:hypothetical protein
LIQRAESLLGVVLFSKCTEQGNMIPCAEKFHTNRTVRTNGISKSLKVVYSHMKKQNIALMAKFGHQVNTG